MDKNDNTINNDMKITYKIVSLIAVLTLLVGCATFFSETSTTGQTLQMYLPYIEPTVSIATSTVFSYAVSEKDKEAKANVIYKVSGVVENLSKGKPLGPEQFEEILKTNTPGREHWTRFVAIISSVYSSVYYRVSGDAKISLETLSAIARGLRSGVYPYLKKDFKEIVIPDSL